MAATTSLLKSAASLAATIRRQQDAYAAYDWENSSQTYEDYVTYSKFLQDQQAKSSDPSDQLTYAGKIRSAQRSYTSNEIQRSQMAVMEGRATTSNKMDQVFDLYHQAVDNGDYNLAQNLASQYDSLSIQMQNEAKAAASAGAARSASSVTSAKKEIKDLYKAVVGTDGADGSGYVKMPDGTVVKSLGRLSEELKQSGSSVFASGEKGNFFREAADSMSALSAALTNIYQNTDSQDIVDFMQEETADGKPNKYGAVIDGSKTIKIGGMDLSYNDLENAAVNEGYNNPLYHATTERNPATGELEFKLQKNQTANFAYVYDAAQGGYVPLPIQATKRSPFGALDNPITDAGELIDSKTGSYSGGEKNVGNADTKHMTILQRLQNLGYEVLKKNDAAGTFQLTDGTNVYEATVGPDGKIRFYGQAGQYSGTDPGGNPLPGLFELDVTQKSDKALREVAPDETSDFGVEGNFGGLNSQMTPTGQRATDLITGKVQSGDRQLSPLAKISTSPVDLPNQGPAALTRNFQGGSGTSALLQKSNLYQMELTRQREAAAAQTYQLQSSRVPNLNQTVVRSLASNGAPVKQLVVAKPKPLPVVKPTVAKPTAKIVVPKKAPNVGLGVTVSGNFLQGGGL